MTKSRDQSTWWPRDEVQYVQGLGKGKWNPGSDLRHNRAWWLRQYLRLTEGRDDAYILAGRDTALRILVRCEMERQENIFIKRL